MKLNSTIAASYFGAMVTETSSASNSWVMRGIDAKKDVIIGYNDDGSIFNRPIGVCQLLLTPPEEISDKDAMEVGRVFGLQNMDGYYYEWIGKAIITHHFTMYSPWDDSILDTASNRGLVSNIHSRRYLQLIDWLRRKFYDCGHGAIPSLIAAGVAVKKTK